MKIKPLSRKEFLKKWKGSPTITDVLKIKDYGKRLKIAVIWFPQLIDFVKNFFPELFEKSE